ncbi:MAG TPA: glycoside hydrolase family 44 protein [Oligoflexus sp.]|uniref:glycoside hydrolase family 44 protein n=1 Tax=Oligoflexus sp. TaxID=1971216 RepID=UPI002D34D599|nr:glycoside hydrolase family 44 protein [Oligoflexus sp.]HYX35606.1 glycoside hydrolase family 44 protein [Oligoflexus sp.]
MHKTSLLVFCLFLFGLTRAVCADTVRFQIPKEPRKISPYIYGLGTYLHEDRDQEGVWELRPTLYRWGGNTSSRFNYKLDAWNAAGDWFFRNFKAQRPNMIGRFMEENRRNGAASAITLPMLPWIAKDGATASYPRSKFPQQQHFDGDAGNGRAPDGKPLLADPTTTSIPNSPEFVAEWVRTLKGQFGNHPHFYIMDNEPMLWNSTHRDVHPLPLRYDDYFARYVSFAQAVRKADPEAVIIGPAAWGWLEMQLSAWDIEGPHSKGRKRTDRLAHGDKPFLQWFLDELKKKEQELKVSLLDQLDVHNYPEKDSWPPGGDEAPARRKALLQSTRSLWDRDYRDQSWINEKIYLIPRLKEMAENFKKGTKVAIGEYNYRAERDVSGAVAQAEILGIFAQTGLDSAQYWDFPKRGNSHRWAFILFRNYDGKGRGFGDEWIENSVQSQEELSVYAARQAKDKRITIVLLNKSVDKEQSLQLDLAGLPVPKKLELYSFVSEKLDGVIVRKQRTLPPGKQTTLSLSPLSMHLVELNY